VPANDWENLECIGRKRGTRRKVDREERKVTGEVFDKSTYKILYSLSKKGIIGVMGGVVSTGKEANIFHALDCDGLEMAVKIYRTTTADFNAMQEYIDGDPRFGNVGRSKRKIVYAWTRKEYSNLKRAVDAGLTVPRPVAFQGNVLVMEFIGKDERPAPRLKDVGCDRPADMFEKLTEFMRLLYGKAGLVHADFSEYNVLVREGEPVVIDMGQSVLLSHPQAQPFLRRDVENIVKYFSRFGIDADTFNVLSRVMNG